MAGTLGELVIELGILGNDEGAKKVAKALDELIEKATKAAKEMKNQEQKTNDVDKKNKNVAQSIVKTAKNIGALITAVSGAVVALNSLSQSLVQQNQQWINLTRNSDIALSTFQKWGQVGAAMNASLGEQGAAGAVADLNRRLFEMKLTGQGYEGFALAGIRPTNAEDVLEQLRARIRGLNDTSATYLLERLGIDPRMLSVLRMTRQEFEAMNKEMAKYRLTDKQRQAIQEYHKQMSIVNVKMQYFKDRILVAIMPHLARFMEFFVKIIEAIPKYRGFIIGLIAIITKGFGKWLKAIPLVGKYLKPVVKMLQTIRIFGKGLLSGLSGFITKIPIIGRLFGVLGGAISRAFWPLTIAFLLLDDFATFQRGGDSVIGDAVEYFKQLGQTIKDIATVFTKHPIDAWLSGVAVMAEFYIKLLQRILNIIDSIFSTPLGKWLQQWLQKNNFQENMDQLKDDLNYDAEQIRKEAARRNQAGQDNILPSSVTNNNGNKNEYNINDSRTINVETERVDKNFIQGWLHPWSGLSYTNRTFNS